MCNQATDKLVKVYRKYDSRSMQLSPSAQSRIVDIPSTNQSTIMHNNDSMSLPEEQDYAQLANTKASQRNSSVSHQLTDKLASIIPDDPYQPFGSVMDRTIIERN